MFLNKVKNYQNITESYPNQIVDNVKKVNNIKYKMT